FAEKEIFHVLGDEVLRLFLPWHETILVQNHLHALFPELPRGRRDVLVDALAELTGPGRRIESGHFFLILPAKHFAPALIADRCCRWRRIAWISHEAIVLDPPAPGVRGFPDR